MTEAIERLVAEEQLGAVATVVEDPHLGAKAVLDYDAGYVACELPSEVAADVLADAKALMDHEQNRTLGKPLRSRGLLRVGGESHYVGRFRSEQIANTSGPIHLVEGIGGSPIVAFVKVSGTF